MKPIINEIIRLLAKHKVSRFECRVILNMLLGAEYDNEVKEYPDCRDAIHLRFIKERAAIEGRVFGDR